MFLPVGPTCQCIKTICFSSGRRHSFDAPFGVCSPRRRRPEPTSSPPLEPAAPPPALPPEPAATPLPVPAPESTPTPSELAASLSLLRRMNWNHSRTHQNFSHTIRCPHLL
ncbi:unnamed protein product [Urochloa humidicola]